MSSDDTSSSKPYAGNTNSERLTGRVKWFNNRAGFGFVTVLVGEKKDEDVFVHHSGILVNSEQYKYLVQGEYVSFTLKESDNSEHPYQAGEVKGVLDGWLMCETRNHNRNTREKEEEDVEDSSSQRRTRQRRRVKPRGSGPRDGGGNWDMNRNARKNRNSKPQEQNV
tara:strand:+ start:298 stop:798 length:501 start_codon:yes stop_codon:yes gene_type:complete